jgi:hypothetical protein
MEGRWEIDISVLCLLQARLQKISTKIPIYESIFDKKYFY